MPTLPTKPSIKPNRLVAVLTPLVFAPLAGAIAAAVAKYGIDVDDGQLQAIFIAGATIALAKSAQWTKGWQAFEQRDAVDPTDIDEGAFEDEIEAAHEDSIEGEAPALDAFEEHDEGPQLDDAHADFDDDIDEDSHADFDDDMDDDPESSELLVGTGS